MRKKRGFIPITEILDICQIRGTNMSQWLTLTNSSHHQQLTKHKSEIDNRVPWPLTGEYLSRAWSSPPHAKGMLIERVDPLCLMRAQRTNQSQNSLAFVQNLPWLIKTLRKRNPRDFPMLGNPFLLGSFSHLSLISHFSVILLNKAFFYFALSHKSSHL